MLISLSKILALTISFLSHVCLEPYIISLKRKSLKPYLINHVGLGLHTVQESCKRYVT